MLDRIFRYVLLIIGGFLWWTGSTGTLETIPNVGVIVGTMILCYLNYEWGKSEKKK